LTKNLPMRIDYSRWWTVEMLLQATVSHLIGSVCRLRRLFESRISGLARHPPLFEKLLSRRCLLMVQQFYDYQHSEVLVLSYPLGWPSIHARSNVYQLMDMSCTGETRLEKLARCGKRNLMGHWVRWLVFVVRQLSGEVVVDLCAGRPEQIWD
jgi:hypothetical protein